MYNFKNKIDIYINYLLIAFAIVIPLNRPLANAILDITFIIFLFSPNLKEKLNILFSNKLFQIFLAFILYNILVLLWTPDKTYGIKYVFQYFRYFLIFIFAINLKEKYIKYIISAFLLGLFISEITAYGIYFNLWDTYFHSHHAKHYDLTPFMSHIVYSLFLGVGILVILIKFFFENLSIKEKIFLLLFFITMNINMFMTTGRGGQLSFLLTFITLIIYNIFKTKSYKYIYLIIIPIALFIIGYNFSHIFHMRVQEAIIDISNLIDNFNFCGSVGQRAGAWIVSYEILKNPLYLIFGMGFKEPLVFLHHLIYTPQFNYLQCMDQAYSTHHLHNVYLMHITQTGIIGLFLYLSFIYKLLKVDMKSIYLNNIKIAFFSMFIFISFVEPVFHLTWTTNIFLLFSSIIVYYDFKKSFSP